MSTIHATLRCPCGETDCATTFCYDTVPQGETVFDLGGQAYLRRYEECRNCKHWFSRHDLDLSRLYDRAYVDTTYGGPDGLRQRFAKIMALPPERSDNRVRVARLQAIARNAGIEVTAVARPRVLDIGAGLGVFPATMQEAGWDAVGIEPDSRSVTHLRDIAGVQAHDRDLFTIQPGEFGFFQAVAFNKVLEHVEDPVAFLMHARTLLAPGGFIYIEVPDIAAAADGPDREEFYIEHHHVFSPTSLAQLMERAGLSILEMARLREPSGKFTLYAACQGDRQTA